MGPVCTRAKEENMGPVCTRAKKVDKIMKYTEPWIEVVRMWNIQATIIPFITLPMGFMTLN